MKRILVPIDFSEQAICAAKVAARIAKKINAEIYLLHMLEMPEGIVDMMAGSDDTPASMLLMKKVHERFNELKKEPFFDGITLHETVQFHKAFDGVISESKKDNIDLIVMGSAGATGITEIVIGSNTEKVVRHSEIPVMVIKKGNENFDINNIVFASDFAKDSKAKFQDVLDFSNLFDAKLHLLYVNTAHRFNSTRKISNTINSFVADFKINNYDTYIYNDISIEKGILNYTNEINADLIALNTHGRSGLSQLINASISEDLANHALKPVITFKI